MNAVANKQYIERLKQVIFHLHKAKPTWVKSVPVHEVFQGRTILKGDIEVFDLEGHPKAKRCYGWSHPDGPTDTDEKFITVLELPPVKDAKTAVQVAIVSEGTKK